MAVNGKITRRIITICSRIRAQFTLKQDGSSVTFFPSMPAEPLFCITFLVASWMFVREISCSHSLVFGLDLSSSLIRSFLTHLVAGRLSQFGLADGPSRFERRLIVRPFAPVLPVATTASADFSTFVVTTSS